MEASGRCVSAAAAVIPELYVPPPRLGSHSVFCAGGQNQTTSCSSKHSGREQECSQNQEPFTEERAEVTLDRTSGQILNSNASLEREGVRHEACEEDPSQALEVEDGSDLEKDGFIPITALSLEQLPESIRTEHHLQTIRTLARRVVCINNNRLSADRPPDFTFHGGDSLRGTGFLFFLEGDTAVVATNKHVLYNDAEVRQASLDLFYDRSFREYRPGETRRVARGRGLGTLRTRHQDDFTLAVFQLDPDVIARLQEHEDPTEAGLPTIVAWARRSFPVTMLPTRTTSSQDGGSEKTVCLISHPEGAHKHVSFGRMVGEDLVSGAFEHDAASRHGSSGAPILVFSPAPAPVPPDSVWYHIGRQPASGRKVAHLQRNDAQLFDVNFIADERFHLDLLCQALDYPKPSVDILLRWTRNMDMAKILSSLSALMRLLSLATCLGSCLHSPDVAALERWRQHLQSLVDIVTEARDAAVQKPPPEPTLTRDHLTSHDTCACPLLWKAVTSCQECDVKPVSSGSRLLLPHATPCSLGHFPTWPFCDGVTPEKSMDADHNKGECFLRDILTDFQLQDADEADVFGYILFLLRRILHIISCLASLRPNVEGDLIASPEPCVQTPGCHPSVAEGCRQAKQRQVMEGVLDLMHFGLAAHNFSFVLLHVVCSKFLDMHDLMLGPGHQSSGHVLEEESTGQGPCRSGLSHHQLRHGAAMADARRMLHHAHAHYDQDRQDDQDAAGAGTKPEMCKCSRPSPLALEEAVRHLRALVQGHTPGSAGVAKQVADSGLSGEKAASFPFDQSGLAAPSEQTPVSEAWHSASVEDEVIRRAFEELNDERDDDETSGDESFVLEANTGQNKEETNTNMKKRTKKERLFHSSKQSFEKVLLRIRNSMRQYVTNASEEDESSPRTTPNGDEHFEAITSTFPKLLSATKASLSTMMALHCLRQAQAATDAGPAETQISDEDVERLKDALPKTLPFLLRFSTSVEVFLHNSRLFLELCHPLLHCQCRDFGVRLWKTSSDLGTEAAGTETDPSDGGEGVADTVTEEGTRASTRASLGGEEDPCQEDTARPASEASREDGTAQEGLSRSVDDPVTSATTAASRGRSPAADAVVSAVRRVEAPGLDKDTLDVICASLASLSFQGLTAEDVRPLCDVIEALDLSDIQAEDFASLCDVIQALDLGGIEAEDIRLLCEGARSRADGKVKREDVQTWLGLLKLLDLKSLSGSDVSMLVTLARTMAAENPNEES